MLNTASHVLCTVAYLMKAPYSKPLFLKVSRVLEREGDEARGSDSSEEHQRAFILSVI